MVYLFNLVPLRAGELKMNCTAHCMACLTTVAHLRLRHQPCDLHLGLDIELSRLVILTSWNLSSLSNSSWLVWLVS